MLVERGNASVTGTTPKLGITAQLFFLLRFQLPTFLLLPPPRCSIYCPPSSHVTPAIFLSIQDPILFAAYRKISIDYYLTGFLRLPHNPDDTSRSPLWPRP